MPQKHLTLHSKVNGSICHYVFSTEKRPLSKKTLEVGQYTEFREVRYSLTNDLSMQLLKVVSITAKTTMAEPWELVFCLQNRRGVDQVLGLLICGHLFIKHHKWSAVYCVNHQCNLLILGKKWKELLIRS